MTKDEEKSRRIFLVSRFIGDGIMRDEEKRKAELEMVKELIKENIDCGDCGLYRTRNLTGDDMSNIYRGEYITLYICYGYAYFEVFGLTPGEWKDLQEFYVEIGGYE